MRNGGVWEAESNMELFALVSVERIMITPLVIMKAPWASRSMLHAYARLAESCVDSGSFLCGGAQCLTADASWSLCCLPSMGPSGWDSWLVVEQATLLRRGTLHERIFSH
jgi:hypothetical protein